MSALDRLEAALAEYGCNPKRRGEHVDAKCPAHDDRVASLTADQRADKVLVKCHAGNGCPTEDIIAAIGLAMTDLFDQSIATDSKLDIANTYDYCDETGTLLYQVVRLIPKSFRQRRPDGRGGWEWSLNGTGRVPYRLPELIAGIEAGRWVLIAEGEKDAERLRSLGLVATTNAAGAGRWSDDWRPYFAGARVAVLPDNDVPGRDHAQQIARSLYGTVAELRIVELPDLPEKGDVSDWLDEGHGLDELKRLVFETATWSPRTSAPSAAAQPIEDKNEPNRRPVSIRLADVEPEDVRWLWPGRVPLGKVTIIDGDPDLGKSTLTLDLAARATTGSPMPDGLVSDLDGPVDVVLVSIEDGAADTIRPRADAAGADVSRIHLLNDVEIIDDEGATKTLPWIMPRDLDMLRQAIEEAGAKLVILDPLSGVVDSKVNLHNDQDTRTALRPLASMADEMGFAVVALRHLNKSGGQNAKHRGGGSIAIIGAARSGLLVGLDPDDDTEETKVIATTKHNLAKPVPSLRYKLVAAAENDAVARVEWLGESPLSAGALLATPETDDQRSDRDDIAEIICELTAGGPYPYQEAVKQIRTVGYTSSEATIRRAIKQAGCVTDKAQGFGGKRSIQRIGGDSSQSSQAPTSSIDGTGDGTGLSRENALGFKSPVTAETMTGLGA